MKYTFQHFVDLKTSAESMQIIQVDAGGDYLMQRTRHLWPAFKYMKMGTVSIKLLPASTLPVDPLGLSYEDDEKFPTVDPRDQMNPGLVRITNGEDLDTRVPENASVQMGIYNNMMLDPRWSKFMLQSGFKRYAKPLYWQVGQLHQDAFPGSIVNAPKTDASGTKVVGVDTLVQATPNEWGDGQRVNFAYGTLDANHSDPRGFFQTGHRGRMGWIPTDALIKSANLSETASGDGTVRAPSPNVMPCINCITVVLPKMYRTNYYYRMFITETVYFSGLKNVGINDTEYNEYAGIDNFVRAGWPQAKYPLEGTGEATRQFAVNQTSPNRWYTDLNDGSDE